MKKIKELYLQYKEVINYLFFGGCSTLVNLVSFGICFSLFKINDLWSQVIAWVVAVIFAYVTNKLFVFEAKANTKKDFIKEITSFMVGRVFTLVLCDIATYAFMTRVLHINEYITKIVTQVLVVVLNYAISKLIVFKKKEEVK